MSSASVIRAFLGGVRRRLRQAVWLEAAVAGLWSLLAIAAATLLVARWAEGRAAVAALGLVGAGVALGVTLVPAWRRVRRLQRSDAAVARYVEQRVAGLHNGLVTAVELGDVSGARRDAEEAGHSARLVEGAQDAAARRVRGLPPGSLVDLAGARAHGKVLAGVAALVALVALLWPAAFGEGLERLLTPPPEPVAVAPAAERFVDVAARDIRLRYVFPAYTGLGEREIAGSSGDIAALAGTTVHFEARSTEAAVEAFLELGEGDEPSLVPLHVEAGGALRGQLVLSQPGTYRVRLVAPDGQLVRERLGRAVDVQPDDPPDVVLLLPEADLEVHSDDQVRLAYRARDDFGLSKVELVANLLGPGEPIRKRLATLQGERQDQGEARLAVGELGAKPGDAVEVWFEATDQDSVNGPNVGRSESRTIKVWSPREKHQAVVDDLAALAEAMLDLLGDRLEAPTDTKELTRFQEIVGSISQINARTHKLLDLFSEVLVAAEEDPLMPPEVLAELVAMRARHDELQRSELFSLERVASSVVLPERRLEQLALLGSHDEENVEALEKDIMLLEDLVSRLREDLLKDKTRDLLSQQEQLMKLLEQLASGDDDAAAKALEQIDELQRQMEEMMAEMAKQMKEMPAENFNQGALDPEQQMAAMKDFRDQLEEMKRKIAEGDIEGAMADAAEMQKAMADMLAQMEEGMEGMGGSGLSASQQKKLSEMDRKVGELAEREQKILEETDKLNQELMEAVREQMKAKMEAFMNKQKDKAKALRDKIDEADRESLSEADRDQLEQARQRANQLEDALEQARLDQAKRQAEEASGQCDKAGGAMGQSANKASGTDKAKELQEAADRMGEAGKIAQEIADDIANAMPNPSDMLGEEQKQRMKELAQQQAKNREALKELREKMGEMGGELPGLPQMFEESLGGAEREMGEAEGALEGNEPGKAQGHEQAALEGLGQARRRMKQMLMPNRRGGDGRGVSNEDTPIPQAEDYQVPEEARREIMQRRRENAPSIFQPLLDRYYEELLR